MSLELASREQGEGPPLIILHGLFGSARNWEGIARKLAADWRVHALDLRNHGDSPWAKATDYPAMAEDVLAYLDRRGLSRAVVVGHSMGGKTAMALALTAGERVAALVVVDIAPVAYAHSFAPFIEAMKALDLSALSRRAEADALLAPAIADSGIRSFLMQNLANRDGGLVWRPNLEALKDGIEDISGFPEALLSQRFQGPTLFLGGGASDYVGPPHHDLIGRLFPAARIDSVADAGHWVHAENPAGFLAKLMPFLAEVSRAL